MSAALSRAHQPCTAPMAVSAHTKTETESKTDRERQRQETERPRQRQTYSQSERQRQRDRDSRAQRGRDRGREAEACQCMRAVCCAARNSDGSSLGRSSPAILVAAQQSRGGRGGSSRRGRSVPTVNFGLRVQVNGRERRRCLSLCTSRTVSSVPSMIPGPIRTEGRSNKLWCGEKLNATHGAQAHEPAADQRRVACTAGVGPLVVVWGSLASEGGRRSLCCCGTLGEGEPTARRARLCASE